MPNWKKLIVSGSDAALSSLTVTNQVTASSYTGSFTGSFAGDGSGLTGIDTNPFPYTGSADILGELNLTANGNIYVDNDYVDNYIRGNPALTVNDDALFLGGAEFKSKGNDYVDSDYIFDYVVGGTALTVYDNAIFSGSVLANQISGSLSGSFEGNLNVEQLRISSTNNYVDTDYVVDGYVGGIALITTGSAIIEGGATIKGPLIQEGGQIVFTQVSESLNFTNDAGAASGGVPLGGIYRNGNDIKIRIT